ncbi:hypothetical protein F4808DRAFT_409253 [Astrocystis sublimbata]|nr:hypothetical protein F4808DRAFT_409253 [Astrocystis sublimbata]
MKMRSLAASVPPLALALALAICIIDVFSPCVRASTVLTFSDGDCRTRLASVAVPDALDGMCTKFHKGYSSLMIGTLGTSCTATFYGDDPMEPIYSQNNRTLAEEETCYNSLWLYFSVDDCEGSGATASGTTTAAGAIVNGNVIQCIYIDNINYVSNIDTCYHIRLGRRLQPNKRVHACLLVKKIPLIIEPLYNQ